MKSHFMLSRRAIACAVTGARCCCRGPAQRCRHRVRLGHERSLRQWLASRRQRRLRVRGRGTSPAPTTRPSGRRWTSSRTPMTWGVPGRCSMPMPRRDPAPAPTSPRPAARSPAGLQPGRDDHASSIDNPTERRFFRGYTVRFNTGGGNTVFMRRAAVADGRRHVRVLHQRQVVRHRHRRQPDPVRPRHRLTACGSTSR